MNIHLSLIKNNEQLEMEPILTQALALHGSAKPKIKFKVNAQLLERALGIFYTRR